MTYKGSGVDWGKKNWDLEMGRGLKGESETGQGSPLTVVRLIWGYGEISVCSNSSQRKGISNMSTHRLVLRHIVLQSDINDTLQTYITGL